MLDVTTPRPSRQSIWDLCHLILESMNFALKEIEQCLVYLTPFVTVSTPLLLGLSRFLERQFCNESGVCILCVFFLPLQSISCISWESSTPVSSMQHEPQDLSPPPAGPVLMTPHIRKPSPATHTTTYWLFYSANLNVLSLMSQLRVSCDPPHGYYKMLASFMVLRVLHETHYGDRFRRKCEFPKRRYESDTLM